MYRSQDLAWLITGPLAVAAVVLTLPVVVDHHHQAFGSLPLGVAFLGLFAFADATLLRFEIRRQSFSLTLAEVPLLLGLFYLPPLTLLLVRVLSVVLLYGVKRAGVIKLSFNVASFAAGAARSASVQPNRSRSSPGR